MLAPIVIFAYNRPDHLRRTLESLAKNDLADQSELYIYCDGAKEDATQEQKVCIEKTRQVAHNAIGFKSITIIERPSNIGLMENIVDGVTSIVNKYGRIIVFEDDMITSEGTLIFFNNALELYQDEMKIMHIVSYMFPHKYPLPNTFLYSVPYPGGGWATWKRAWQYYPTDIGPLYNYWRKHWAFFNYWNHDGVDLVKQLEDNYNGTLRTWFIRWYAVLLKMGGLTLYPGKSLVTNIGFDGSGENCVRLERNPYWVENLASTVPVKKIRRIKENPLAAREIYAFHSGYWYNRRRRMKFFNQLRKWLRI